MNELIVMKGKNMYTTTLAVCEGINNEHNSVMLLLNKYSYLDVFADLLYDKSKPKLGRPVDFAYLSELQATVLITLMKNSPQVIEFKVKLSKAFFKQRKMLQDVLTRKENAEWLARRNDTKSMRLEETDMIKKFINYATDQGSKNVHHYYSNITKMEYKGLFLMEQKYPNIRDVMNFKQLNIIEAADQAVSIALEDGMEQGLNYKEIYLLAKNKIEALAKIFPKSPLPLLLDKKE